MLIDSRDSIRLFCGAFFVRRNYSIAHHCSDAPRRELPREPLPTNRAKAPIQTSARIAARLLPPTAAIVSSRHDPSDPNEIGYLPPHALPARPTCGDRATASNERVATASNVACICFYFEQEYLHIPTDNSVGIHRYFFQNTCT